MDRALCDLNVNNAVDPISSENLMQSRLGELGLQSIDVDVACVAGGIVWVRESFDGGAVFQKKGVGTRRLKYRGISRGFAARDGSAVKSHSTTSNLTRLLHNTASYAG